MKQVLFDLGWVGWLGLTVMLRPAEAVESVDLSAPERTARAYLEAVVAGDPMRAARCYLPAYREEVRRGVGSAGQHRRLVEAGARLLTMVRPGWREELRLQTRVWDHVARVSAEIVLPFEFMPGENRFPLWLNLAREGEEWLIDDNPLAVLLLMTADWRTLETAHIIYHFPTEGLITQRDRMYHEQHLRRLTALMATPPAEKIHYFRAATREQLFELGYAADLGEGYYHLVVCAESRFAHELTHAALVQQPPNNWLSEGLAVYYGNDWDYPWEDPLEVQARRLLERNQLVPLSQLVHTPTYLILFPNFDQVGAVIYPQAGALVKFLMTEYPLAKFRELFARADLENGAQVLEELYGKPLAELEAEWKAWLRATAPPASSAGSSAVGSSSSVDH